VDDNVDDLLNGRWKKNIADNIEQHSHYLTPEKTLLKASGNNVTPLLPKGEVEAVPCSASEGMDRRRHQQSQEVYPFNCSADASNGNGSESNAVEAIANPASLPPLHLNNNVLSMPNPNQSTDHSRPQRLDSGTGNSSDASNRNNAAWLQHMILNPIHPLQNNPLGVNTGNNVNSVNNQATALAQQQQLRRNSHNDANNNNSNTNQLGGAAVGGASSVGSSLSRHHQQQQALKESMLSSTQNLQQGFQLNQLLSLQQQQQQLASRINLPSVRDTSQEQQLLQQQQQQQQLLQQGIATSNSNQIAALSTALSAASTAQQQQLLLMALMLQHQNNNSNNTNINIDTATLSSALSSPEGTRIVNSFLLGQQLPSLKGQQQQSAQLYNNTTANSNAASLSSSLGVNLPQENQSNQQNLFYSPQPQQPMGLSMPPPLSLVNPTSSETPFTAMNPPFQTSVDISSDRIDNLNSDNNPSVLTGDSSSVMAAGDTINFPSTESSTKSKKKSKGGKADSNKQNPDSLFPRVLYCETDDAILGEYQTLLRQQLELFEADSHDVINGTFRQGRTTPIQLGQIGLRCKHCATAPLSIRTKGSVYCKWTIFFVLSIVIRSHIS